MRKFLLILVSLLCLTGCERASSEVVLRDVSGLESSEIDVTTVEKSDASSCYTADASEASDAQVSITTIVVYVCGAVRAPGVYELTEGARINDAVMAAGGFSEEADTDYVNLAAALKDGMKLRIPTMAETAAGSDTEAAMQTQNGTMPESYDTPVDSSGDLCDGDSELVNINTASKEQLMTLPGIGEKVATRIIEYRDKNGNFRKKEDIMKISGIKDKLFSKISDKITV
ncbi:helix-hairpin-helix domain-containing protein [Butyrivibrio sp. AE3009]|uniref:helix-hairpin-helix domain-containing protein n=1 Tax=Butyrivibrio sp. AE3009 TaxID=1280666 RepID=UPI0003B5529C|nr:helix-hairpin-helix domain-containing protein [Butyrivibrio sp. AE3009]